MRCPGNQQSRRQSATQTAMFRKIEGAWGRGRWGGLVLNKTMTMPEKGQTWDHSHTGVIAEGRTGRSYGKLFMLSQQIEPVRTKLSIYLSLAVKQDGISNSGIHHDGGKQCRTTYVHTHAFTQTHWGRHNDCCLSLSQTIIFSVENDKERLTEIIPQTSPVQVRFPPFFFFPSRRRS